MTFNQLVGECYVREECTQEDGYCPFSRECALFKDVFGHSPDKMVYLSERQKEVVIKHIKELLERR